jgi:chromosome segregation ATPase
MFLNSAKQQLESSLGIQVQQAKDKIRRQDERISAYSAEVDRLQTLCVRLEKEKKGACEDKEKLRSNLQKIVARKGKMDQHVKVCSSCQKEYNEKENFNWSCRTHQSEWGGEMWWCCGKRGKD